MRVSAETTVYFAADVAKRSETNVKSIWGSTSQVDPQNVTIASGQSYPLERTTYYQVYTAEKCYFTLPAGAYDIVADTKNGTVQFSDYTGRYRAKPATLYMRNNTFGTIYGSATGTDGVYTFTFDKSGSMTTEPFRVVFTEATSLTAAQKAAWVLGSTSEAANVTPEYGKAYPLVDVDPDVVNSTMNGTFMPLYPQKYSVVVDLNAMTVTFNPLLEVNELTTLNLLGDNLKLVGKADREADGKYHYSYRSSQPMKVFFSTATNSAELKTAQALSFGAGGHAAPVNIEVVLGNSYAAEPISYRRVYTDKLGFYELPGKCDIELDLSTGMMTVSEYTGNYDSYPEKLYIKSAAFTSNVYGTAEGVDGVYTFEYTTPSVSAATRNIIFTDGTSYSNITPASWVLGASEDGSIVEPYPGMVTGLYDVVASDVRDKGKGYFTPYQPHTYTITVDLRNRTVKWGEPEPAPARLNLLDANYTALTSSVPDSKGVFTFKTRSYSSHPVFIASGESLSELRGDGSWIYLSTPQATLGDVDITDGCSGPVSRGTYYRVLYLGSGHWITPEGINNITARLNTADNTIEWSVSPFVPRTAEVLYMLNRDLQPIAQIVSDNSGIFEFDVNMRSSGYVGFSDSASDVNDPDRTFYGSSVPYGGTNLTPESGSEYPIYVTSGDAISSSKSTFYLPQGRWHVRVDMNTKKAFFEDITRGGVWYLPESVELCDDDLNVIATATKTADGVFTFSNVNITTDKEIRKVVLRDTAEGGSLFGANASGEVGPVVESSTVYNLYMPTKLWVVDDGASCFGLRPATYNITADFNNKTIVFVDPSIPIYPTKISMTKTGDEGTSTVSTVNGSNGVYTYSLRNSEAITVYFTDPADGTLYGSATTAPEVKSGSVISVAAAAEPVAFTIPEGLWRVEFSLADMKAKFTETPRPKFVSTNMPSGSKFHSYFGTGTDSKAVFTFNNKLRSVSGVYVVLGDYEGGVPNEENETTALGLRAATISDNNLIVDFTGQRYAIPEGAEPKVHIVLSKVVDDNGETLVSDALEGLPAGSMVFEYPFSEFERIAVRGKFDLASGSNIDEIKQLKMRVNHFDDISFSNVIFEEYKALEPSIGGSGDSPDVTAEPRRFAARWERGATDAEGFTELTVDVPMAIRGLGDFRLCFENLDINDGYDDHADDVAAIYVTKVDPTVTVVSTPEDGSTVGRVDEIVLTWNHPLISSVGNKASKAVIVNTDSKETVEATYSYPADEKSLVLTPASAIEAAGNYRLEIGGGDLVFNDDADAVNNPLALSFAIDPSLGIAGIVIADTDDVVVVDLSGIVVRRGKGRATLSGLSGIYIVNGVKCRLSEQ